MGVRVLNPVNGDADIEGWVHGDFVRAAGERSNGVDRLRGGRAGVTTQSAALRRWHFDGGREGDAILPIRPHADTGSLDVVGECSGSWRPEEKVHNP
jgi:hypothetical protein